ncbi:hypothetical protein BJV77DRAFT_541531 [Russula vinacea]|nr:hypothetical protein BJV77DRAFT_541531 [Russula vinacea]
MRKRARPLARMSAAFARGLSNATPARAPHRPLPVRVTSCAEACTAARAQDCHFFPSKSSSFPSPFSRTPHSLAALAPSSRHVSDPDSSAYRVMRRAKTCMIARMHKLCSICLGWRPAHSAVPQHAARTARLATRPRSGPDQNVAFTNFHGARSAHNRSHPHYIPHSLPR